MLGAAACVVVLAAGGCVFKGATEIFTRPTPQPGAWLPAPVRIRVYPASRFATDPDSKTVVLDARIELFDEMADSVKGAGQFHFELLNNPRRESTALERRLYSWDVPMLTLEQQRKAYDKVTQTYLFRLKMDDLFFPTKDTTLKATFTPSGGQPLRDEVVMPGTARGE